MNRSFISIILILSLCIWCLVYNLSLKSNIYKLRNLNFEIESNLEKIVLKKYDLNHLKENTLKLNWLELKNKSLKSMIPLNLNLNKYIIEFKNIINKYNLNLKDFNYKNYILINIENTDLYEIPIELSVTGLEQKIMEFIKKLNTSNDIYNLKSINLNINSDGITEANLYLSTYALEICR